MKKAVIYVVILGVLCAGVGVVGGIVIDRRYIRTHFPRIIRDCLQGSGTEEKRSARTDKMIERLRRELDLSNEQVEQVRHVLNQLKPEIDQIRGDFKKDLLRIRGKLIIGVSEVLDLEQKEKLDKLIKDRFKG